MATRKPYLVPQPHSTRPAPHPGEDAGLQHGDLLQAALRAHVVGPLLLGEWRCPLHGWPRPQLHLCDTRPVSSGTPTPSPAPPTCRLAPQTVNPQGGKHPAPGFSTKATSCQEAPLPPQ